MDDLARLQYAREQTLLGSIPEGSRVSLITPFRKTGHRVELRDSKGSLGTLDLNDYTTDKGLDIEYIHNTRNGEHKVGEDLYNSGILYSNSIGREGLVSGHLLLSPEKTQSTLKHFPGKIKISDKGEWEWGSGTTYNNPIYRLTEPGERPIVPTRDLSVFSSDIIDKDGNFILDWSSNRLDYANGGSINKFAEGGNMLPEIVVTPRMNYINYTGDESVVPSLEEYKEARRTGIRANALLDMQNTINPTIPSIPNKMGRAFKKVFGDWYDDEDVKFIFGVDKNPSTCISTVSSKYNRMVPGNITFRNRSNDLGFMEIPESERDHGDIVQTVGRRGVPGHAAMVSGFTRDGKMLVDESHGGLTSGTIEHDVDYFDTNPELKKKLYYRFIGNHEDNKQWEKEYKAKYHKYVTGGGLDEDNYTPNTLAGFLVKTFTGDDTKAAYTDIVSAGADLTVDAIPIVGTAAGVVLSAGDSLYDLGKLVYDPSLENAADLGSSLLSLVPGMGSIKDVKASAKAARQIARNVVTTKTGKAIKRTVVTPPKNRVRARTKNNTSINTRVNVLRKDGKVKSSYSLMLPARPNPLIRGIGTIGNGIDFGRSMFNIGNYIKSK